jgi:hypothetical protein
MFVITQTDNLDGKQPLCGGEGFYPLSRVYEYQWYDKKHNMGFNSDSLEKIEKMKNDFLHEFVAYLIYKASFDSERQSIYEDYIEYAAEYNIKAKTKESLVMAHLNRVIFPDVNLSTTDEFFSYAKKCQKWSGLDVEDLVYPKTKDGRLKIDYGTDEFKKLVGDCWNGKQTVVFIYDNAMNKNIVQSFIFSSAAKAELFVAAICPKATSWHIQRYGGNDRFSQKRVIILQQNLILSEAPNPHFECDENFEKYLKGEIEI